MGPSFHSSAPWLLLISYPIHLIEEWAGDLPLWTATALGSQISLERFIQINSFSLVIFIVGIILSYKTDQMKWFRPFLASLLGLNGLLHTLGTLAFGSYSPGVITGLVLYLPLSYIILSTTKKQLSLSAFNFALIGGIGCHLLISWLAFM